MPLKRTEIELSVERELSATPVEPAARARLTARYVLASEGPPPTAEELRRAFEELRGELTAAVGSAPPGELTLPRRERELAELVETSRPRQSELVELLREEGELTEREHRLLVEYLRETPARPPPRREGPTGPAGANPEPAPSPPYSPPLAAAPLEVDRTPILPRPVPELLAAYQITSLKQAGAVRARRQISFEEYMALKRHFSSPAPSVPEGPPETQ